MATERLMLAETSFPASTLVIYHPLQQTRGCNHKKDHGQLIVWQRSYLNLTCLYHSQCLLLKITEADRPRECQACYISERKLPSKWLWLHLQTSAAHSALHCSPSHGIGSQAALTALLLPASLTDVPETHSFTVRSPLQSVCQPTSDHGGEECSSVRRRCWPPFCRKWLGWASYSHHSVAVPHTGY